MRTILIVMLFFVTNFYSQNIEIVTTKDSLKYYFEKYKECSSVAASKIKSMRVSYIFLDEKQLTIDKINQLRNDIIAKFKKGQKFSELANKFTMDSSKDGDLGWFDEGMMVKVFEDEIKKHKKGDVFTIDIPENNWYYVVYKTFDDKEKVKLIIEK